MLYSFDPAVWGQVRGQLETNLAHICQPTDPSNRCVPGQAIHHFVPNLGYSFLFQLLEYRQRNK